MMHVVWSEFIKVAERILQCIFTYPYTGCQLIPIEIFQRGIISFIVTIMFIFHRYLIVVCFG